jgi:hypothetical protein
MIVRRRIADIPVGMQLLDDFMERGAAGDPAKRHQLAFEKAYGAPVVDCRPFFPQHHKQTDMRRGNARVLFNGTDKIIQYVKLFIHCLRD